MTNEEALKQFKDYLLFEKQYASLTVKSYLTDLEGFLSFVKNEGFADLLLEIDRERVFGH